MCDDVWEVRLHFHDRDNLERTMCVSDITFLNLIALIETAGYGEDDYMYFVRDAGLGVAGLEEICDDDKVDEMLDHIANRDQTIVNLTVVRGSEPRPGDLNIGHVCEQQVPIGSVGERTVYEVSEEGVVYKSPSKKTRRVAQVDEQEAQDMDQGNAGDVDLEQEELERTMELKRRNKIQRYKKHKKSVERVEAVKRKLLVLLTEDDSDLEEDEDFMARMAELRRQREDPLLHFEGDNDVDELYEIQEEVHEENAEQEEHGDHEELEKEVLPEGKKRKKLKVRKGPTSRSHASLEQKFEDVWVPSSDEDLNPADLKEEEDDGAVPLAFVLGSKSRAKKPKPRVWYHEDRESP